MSCPLLTQKGNYFENARLSYNVCLLIKIDGPSRIQKGEFIKDISHVNIVYIEKVLGWTTENIGCFSNDEEPQYICSPDTDISLSDNFLDNTIPRNGDRHAVLALPMISQAGSRGPVFEREKHTILAVSLMCWATVIETAQTRERSNSVGQLQRSPASEEKRWIEEKKIKKNIKGKKILFIRLSLWKFIEFSRCVSLSVSSGSWGNWGETGALQGRQEMRPGPLKEVPHCRETSTSQVWFSGGWLECVCLSVSVCMHVFRRAGVYEGSVGTLKPDVSSPHSVLQHMSIKYLLFSLGSWESVSVMYTAAETSCS